MAETTRDIRITSLVAPPFLPVHRAIRDGGVMTDGVWSPKTHYWLCGGRGSTKSSFASIQVALGVMRDPNANAVVIRKVADTLRDSVFAQMLWAIEQLGASREFIASVAPMEIRHAGGGKILFRGLDKPEKLKSLKFTQGYAKIIWAEETDQFNGMAEIRNVLQSLMRGGDAFTVLYSYNPPRHRQAFVNLEEHVARDDRLVHRSCYTDVPPEWLGETFLREAAILREHDEKSYRHEYLGEPVGVGGVVFDNLTIRAIPDDECAAFDRIRNGIDWGFDPHPTVHERMHYDPKKRTLYLFDEYTAHRKGYDELAADVKPRIGGETIFCDSAEPRGIQTFYDAGMDAYPVKKGPQSIMAGIRWLQTLKEIVIDPDRAPLAAKQFPLYEYVRTKDGEYTSKVPDKDDDAIDAARYGCAEDVFGG